ncbi:MAG: hypothetical protein DHS20C19_17360 [Acidimicrobiales bacterium]|nr:MAG: hypothetical protein DHS20C19_17360 [Acidimicrobiales bacterium]
MAKSGSPAPKPMTFSPAARNAFALFDTARVAEGAIAPTRREIRPLLVSVLMKAETTKKPATKRDGFPHFLRPLRA